MKIVKLSGSHGMCGGYDYFYDVEFDTQNPTIAEALKEISSWRETQPHKDFGCAYGTYVNDKIVESTWHEPEWMEKYLGDKDNERASEVKANGGWCCGINIYLYTEKEE